MKSIDVLIGSIFDVLPIILPMKRWMDMNEWYLDDHPGIIQVLYFKPMSWPFFMKGRYFFPPRLSGTHLQTLINITLLYLKQFIDILFR